MVGWQVPAVWQSSSATQAMGFVPTHVPARHESVCVQELPSSQLVPLALGSGSQRLALSLHTPSLH